MRLSSQNNQFRFNFPTDFVSDEVNNKLKRYMEKNWIPYENPIDYINSTIKEIVFPSVTYEGSEQTLRFGKKIEWKSSQNIHDTYNSSLDITLRSVDSHTNYFMLQQILAEYFNNTRKHYIPWLNLDLLDKDGDILYTVILRSVLLKSLSEVRLMYQSQDVSESTFSLTIKFNFIDVNWKLSDQDGSPDFPQKPENIFDTETWDHSNDILPTERPQNNYSIDND